MLLPVRHAKPSEPFLGVSFLTFSSARAALLDYATMLVGYKRSICPETGRLRWRDSAYPILRLI